MAGGPSTVALCQAVIGAGGFAFTAAGYKNPDDLALDIASLRSSDDAFGVNVFVPNPTPIDRAAFAAYAAALQEEAEPYGVRISAEPISDDDWWGEKISLLVNDPVPVVSFTFGLPDAAAVRSLQQVGTRVLQTVTRPEEASAADALGVDGIIVQGARAGGHSASFDPGRIPEPIDTAELMRRVRGVTNLPLIAAGGVDGPDEVAALIAAGAESVTVGTLLLRTDEAGTSAVHQDALADTQFTETVLTKVFTGRVARALRNRYIDRYRDVAPTAYPAVHHLTRELRAAARAAGDTDRLHLWAGTGYRHASTGPAGTVIETLAERL